MTGIYIGFGLTALLAITLLIITIRLAIKAKKQKKKRESHRQMLLQIIDSGGESVTDNNGNTPLILAVRYGFLDVFEKLLKKNAELDASDNNGNTAMHFAAALNNIKVLNSLKEKGANVNARSQSGTTPIMVAIKARTFEAIQFFIDSKANLKLENTAGLNAFDLAKAEWENPERQKKDSNKMKKKQAAFLQEMQQVNSQP